MWPRFSTQLVNRRVFDVRANRRRSRIALLHDRLGKPARILKHLSALPTLRYRRFQTKPFRAAFLSEILFDSVVHDASDRSHRWR